MATEIWDDNATNKLQQLELELCITFLDETKDRLRIGHTHLAHAHLLHGNSPPNCIKCQSKLTVEHLLFHCSVFDSQRSRHFHAKTLKELFYEVPPRTIIQFLKDINIGVKNFSLFIY